MSVRLNLTPSGSILGKQDTMVDLTMDLIGGLVAGLVSLRMLRERDT